MNEEYLVIDGNNCWLAKDVFDVDMYEVVIPISEVILLRKDNERLNLELNYLADSILPLTEYFSRGNGQEFSNVGEK